MTIEKSDNIEAKANEHFVNKKNIILISLAFICTIVLIVCAIIFVLDIDFSLLFDQIGKSLVSNPTASLWLLLLVSYILFKIIYTAVPFIVRLNKMKIKVSIWEQFLYSLTICFLAAVTPANFVTDPYNVFWLKTHGFSNSKASAIVWSNAFLWHAIQMLITWPSFIVICLCYNQIATDANGTVTFWFIVIGICIDVVILFGLVFMGWSKHFHLYLAMFVNKTKQILRMKYHTKEETKQKYLERGQLKEEINFLLKDWKLDIVILGIHGINEIFLYVLVYASLALVTPIGTTLDFCMIFNVTNAAVTANKFIPIPGGELTIEYWMKDLLNRLGGIVLPSGSPESQDAGSYIDNAILIWRSFSVYFAAMIGLIGFFGITYKQITSFKRNKKLFSDSI